MAKMAKALRQLSVAEHFARSAPVAEIARKLGVGAQTVRRDILEIKQIWAESVHRSVEDYVSIEDRKLRLIEREAWLAFDEAKAGLEFDSGAENGVRQRQPPHQYLEVVRRSIETRMKLYGLDRAAGGPRAIDDTVGGDVIKATIYLPEIEDIE